MKIEVKKFIKNNVSNILLVVSMMVLLTNIYLTKKILNNQLETRKANSEIALTYEYEKPEDN